MRSKQRKALIEQLSLFNKCRVLQPFADFILKRFNDIRYNTRIFQPVRMMVCAFFYKHVDRQTALFIPESKNEPSQTVLSEIDDFVEPYKPKIRKSGTGCVTMINEHLYEGRYSPKVNGKRMARNVYAKTREECEEKLAELIKTMKAEIAELKKVQNKG